MFPTRIYYFDINHVLRIEGKDIAKQEITEDLNTFRMKDGSISVIRNSQWRHVFIDKVEPEEAETT